MQRRAFVAGSAAVAVATVAAVSSSSLIGCTPASPAITGGFVGANFERGHWLRQSPAEVWARYLKLPQATASPRRTRVLIAGGGVAGLAAARALQLRGMHDFALLELEDTAGGNSRAHRMQGIACPLGAHYLPVPPDSAPAVQDMLESLGLRQRISGRWRYDERVLCHSPQERLYFKGQWQDGLLPTADVNAATLADYRAFSQAVARQARAARFQLPVSSQPLAQAHAALDAVHFEAWLDQQQLARSAELRWYLNYCCMDDYGAGIAEVSAWAGIHYFASRHGFHAPGEEGSEEAEGEANENGSGILTWPEGNGWLTQKLAAPLAAQGQLQTARTVLRIAQMRHGVEADVIVHLPGGEALRERWLAGQCIIALPLFVAARVVENPSPALQAAASALRYAPWLTANLHLSSALLDSNHGAAPSWDNVVYGAASPAVARASSKSGGTNEAGGFSGLGYVNARHQQLTPAAAPGATVLTYYRAFGLGKASRSLLYEAAWSDWRDAVIAELAVPHPDLPGKVTQIDVMRYGHAMSSPVPGIRSHAGLQFMRQDAPRGSSQRLHCAHSDLSGYSVFEEAFSHGHRVGSQLVL